MSRKIRGRRVDLEDEPVDPETWVAPHPKEDGPAVTWQPLDLNKALAELEKAETTDPLVGPNCDEGEAAFASFKVVRAAQEPLVTAAAGSLNGPQVVAVRDVVEGDILEEIARQEEEIQANEKVREEQAPLMSMTEAVGAQKFRPPPRRFNPSVPTDVVSVRGKIPGGSRHIKQRRLRLKLQVGKLVVWTHVIDSLQTIIHRDQYHVRDIEQTQGVVESDEQTLILVATIHDMRNAVGRAFRKLGKTPVCSLEDTLKKLAGLNQASSGLVEGLRAAVHAGPDSTAMDGLDALKAALPFSPGKDEED